MNAPTFILPKAGLVIGDQYLGQGGGAVHQHRFAGHARFPDVELQGQIDFIRDFARIRDDYVRDHG